MGNELLIGKTLNTNAYWLAKCVTNLGLAVTRITVVADKIEEIANVTLEALARKPRFIITTGGLGPTFDDKTLQGIAKALSRKLNVNEKALEMVKEKYEAYVKAGKLEKVELTPPRVKMATLPEGTEPLANPAGTAPAVIAEVGKTILVALPGVPSEMETIFNESVALFLQEETNKVAFSEQSIYADGIMESTLSPLVDQAMHDNPYVYIKSHPRGEEKKPHLEIHFSTTARDQTTAKDRLERAILQMTELIEKNGGKLRSLKEEIHRP